MDIPEEPLDQFMTARPTKKLSPRMFAKAQEYLSEYELTFDQLSPDQQKTVVHYLKKKAACLIAFLIALVLSIVVGVACYLFYTDVVRDVIDLWLPDKYVVKTEDGSKVLRPVEDELQDDIKTYGVFCFLMGLLLGGGIYTGASGLGSAIGSFFSLRRDRKVLHAFLPAVSAPARSNTT